MTKVERLPWNYETLTTSSDKLGPVLTAGDGGWLAVVGNLGKARKSWGRLSRILSREGAGPKVSGHFCKAVSQAVLLFRAETWVLTPRMEHALDIFQHRVAQRLTGRQPRRRGDQSWAYPPLEDAIGKAVFEGIKKSVTRRQNTVAPYIATRPILDLFGPPVGSPFRKVTPELLIVGEISDHHQNKSLGELRWNP